MEIKNILIIMTKLYMGGFSKSLINFLLCAENYRGLSFSVLMLDDEKMELEHDIPENVEIIKVTDEKYKISYFNKFRLFYHKFKYVFFEIYYKYVLKKEINPKYVTEVAQIKNKVKGLSLIYDFEFTKNYDAVISWEECYCNYVLTEKIPSSHKIGFIHPNYVEANFNKKIDKPSLKKLDKIITISKSCYDTLCEVFPRFNNKILYIPNRLNKRYYEKLSNEYVANLNKNEFNILTVNRIDETSKAVFRIVKLMNRLKKDGITAKWYIIGDGDDLPELIKRIKESDLSQNIICVGALNNPYPYMKASDLYIQQSYYEGRPVSVDEAMLLGTPALITNYSSAHEQVTDGIDGWIAENEELKIYEKLKDLLSHPEKISMARENLKKKDYSKYEDCSAMINMINELTEEN